MGVFEDFNAPKGYTASQLSEAKPCKPDYETIIATAKRKQDNTKTLLSALQNYLLPELRYDIRNNSFTLDSLIGRLFIEDLEYDLAIEKLLEQQEAEQK